jgi:hypothetical protein
MTLRPGNPAVRWAERTAGRFCHNKHYPKAMGCVADLVSAWQPETLSKIGENVTSVEKRGSNKKQRSIR